MKTTDGTISLENLFNTATVLVDLENLVLVAVFVKSQSFAKPRCFAEIIKS